METKSKIIYQTFYDGVAFYSNDDRYRYKPLIKEMFEVCFYNWYLKEIRYFTTCEELGFAALPIEDNLYILETIKKLEKERENKRKEGVDL